jgi:DNA-binding GntR family transcriptional regulator
MATLKNRTISAVLLEEIRSRILDGRYPAGMQLRQDGIAEEFSVSRIPVREALFQLEAEGFVRILPHKGATVATISASEVDEAFELRALLEPRLLKLSAPRLTGADYTELDSILADYSRAMADRQTGRWGELNTAFHRTLYSRAQKPRTQAFVANLLQECDRYTRLQLSADKVELQRADREHRRLVALCKKGDVPEAITLLSAHISHVSQALKVFLKSSSNTRELENVR